MWIHVRLFALAKALAGRPEIGIELGEPATVADLKQALGLACPALAPLLPNLMIAVNAEYAADDRKITPDAEVAAIPPVSGGQAQTSLFS